MERHVLNSANWTGVSVGQPGGTGGTPVCGTLAAAEGTINQTYRIYLFCTKAGATNDFLYVASGEGVADNSFDWISRQTPNLEQLRNTGFALAATRRPDAGAFAIDAFFLTTGYKLYYIKHTVTSGQLTQIVDGALGSDRETLYRMGGMAAVPS